MKKDTIVSYDYLRHERAVATKKGFLLLGAIVAIVALFAMLYMIGGA